MLWKLQIKACSIVDDRGFLTTVFMGSNGDYQVGDLFYDLEFPKMLTHSLIWKHLKIPVFSTLNHIILYPKKILWNASFFPFVFLRKTNRPLLLIFPFFSKQYKTIPKRIFSCDVSGLIYRINTYFEKLTKSWSCWPLNADLIRNCSRRCIDCCSGRYRDCPLPRILDWRC